MFPFSHFIQAWILPPGINLILFLICFLIRKSYRNLANIVFTFSFVVLWLLSTPIVAQKLIDTLQNQYQELHLDSVTAQSSFAAIVVLGGNDTQAPEEDNDQVITYDSLSRLNYAAYLHNKTHLPIIVSGGIPYGLDFPESKLMRKSLQESFHISSILEEDKGRNTAEQSKFIVPLLEKHNIKTIYLITNAWHMPRSMYAFNHSFRSTDIKIIPAPMGYIKLSSRPFILNYLPSIQALFTNTVVCHEYIGLIWYNLRNTI